MPDLFLRLRTIALSAALVASASITTAAQSDSTPRPKPAAEKPARPARPAEPAADKPARPAEPGAEKPARAPRADPDTAKPKRVVPGPAPVAKSGSPDDSADEPVSRKPAPAYALGQETDPQLRLVDSDGRLVQLGDFRRKPLVLIFWSSECPVCAGCARRLDKLQELARPFQAVLAAVHSNDNEVERDARQPFGRICNSARRLGLELPLWIDVRDGLAEKFGATTTPEVFLLDGAGVLRFHGSLDDEPRGEPYDASHSPVLLALTALRDGQTVPAAPGPVRGTPIKRTAVLPPPRPVRSPTDVPPKPRAEKPRDADTSKPAEKPRAAGDKKSEAPALKWPPDDKPTPPAPPPPPPKPPKQHNSHMSHMSHMPGHHRHY